MGRIQRFGRRELGGRRRPIIRSSRTSPNAFANLSQKAIRTGRPAPSKSSKVRRRRRLGRRVLRGPHRRRTIITVARVHGTARASGRRGLRLGARCERAATSFEKMGQARPPLLTGTSSCNAMCLLNISRAVLSSDAAASPNNRGRLGVPFPRRAEASIDIRVELDEECN